MHRISIVGSCVTRDLFTHLPEALSSVNLGAYISRATMLSMVAKAPDEVSKLLRADAACNFDDRRFHQDVQKSYFHTLSAAKPDVVIVDLIDERHATWELPDASRMTLTKASRLFLDKHKVRRVGRAVAPLSNEWLISQRAVWPVFARHLRRSVPNARFLVHHAPYARLYLENLQDHPFSTQKNIDDWNAFLAEAYHAVTGFLDAQSLAVSEKFVRGGGQHLWDLTPFHYDRAYYIALWETLQGRLR